MYVNDLGTRDVAKLHSYTGNNGTVKENSSFAQKLQKALEQGKTESTDAEQTGKDSCCEKCNLASQLVSQMMMQSLYMRSGIGGMGLMGLSSLGAGNLVSYQSMMNVLGNNWL